MSISTLYKRSYVTKPSFKCTVYGIYTTNEDDEYECITAIYTRNEYVLIESESYNWVPPCS